MKILIITVSIFLSGISGYSSQSKLDEEINHLMIYIESTDCLFIRNNISYPACKALGHIKKKYNYFIDEIKCAEDFIKYSATKSELSGKYYYIKCRDKEKIRCEQWLLSELYRYRQRGESL